MTTLISTRHWYLIHKWSSLVCTGFLLLLCLTGLPLIFKDEIDDLLGGDTPYAQVPADAPRVSLDVLADAARARYPGQLITSMLIDDDEPRVIVYMTPSWKTFLGPGSQNHSIRFDAHTGAMLHDSTAPDAAGAAFMKLVRDLHTDLFVDLPGALFLAAMGLLFVVAIVSGVLLYGPFMKKLDFGTVRADRSKRIRWLDLHNLLGIARHSGGIAEA
ncbi:PepSY-associated TM helix domain-containing protein [Achromobacter aloeverae]